MQRAFDLLLRPALPLWKYTLLAAPLALFPSVILVGAAYLAAKAFGIESALLRGSTSSASTADAFGAVVFAPVVETLLLMLTVRVLLMIAQNPLYVAAISATLWGAFHGLLSPIRFFGSAWSFFVFTCAILAWRDKSPRHAFLSAAVPHAVINLVAISSAMALGAA